MNKEIIERLKRTAEQCETLEQFIDNVGWENWMYCLLDCYYPLEDGEPLNEYQTTVINNFLKEIWEETKQSDISKTEL